MGLVERFALELARLELGSGPALVAVSGGPDSMVLLDLLDLSRAQHGLELIVAHVNHGIHPDSATPAALVRDRALGLGLPFVSTQLGLGPAAGETRARRERYHWLRAEQQRLAAHWLLTAHHADDQRETVLMRLLRGSGPAGLAGMSRRGRGIARPLLGVSRASLLEHGQARGLAWWLDSANADPRHLRSWVRQDAMPFLRKRLPDLDLRLGQARHHAAGDRRAWNDMLQAWPELGYGELRGVAELDWQVLEGLPRGLAERIVAAALRRVGAPVSGRRIVRALHSLRGRQSGARANLGGNWWLARSFGRLRMEPATAAAAMACPVEVEPLRPPTGQTAWGPWRVRWAIDTAPPRQSRDGQTAWFIPGALLLRRWRPGDRLAPLGGSGHRLAVRCFQEAGVPSSERAVWPVIEGEGGVAWIPGVCRSRDLLPLAGASALRVDVEFEA